MIIAIVVAFTVYFFYANRKQSKGKQLLEETVSPYESVRGGLNRAKSGSGGLQIHLLSIQHAIPQAVEGALQPGAGCPAMSRSCSGSLWYKLFSKAIKSESCNYENLNWRNECLRRLMKPSDSV